MANHCYNHASIDISDANKEKLDAFFKKVLIDTRYGTGMVDLFLVAKEFPHRREFKDMDLASEEAFYKDPKVNTYDMLGSKWFDCCWDDDAISGDSAWSPIIPFIKMLSEEFDFDFEMVFEEGGCEIYGRCGSSEGDYWEEDMTMWEWYAEEGDIHSEIEYRLEDDMLYEHDLSEIKKYTSEDDYKHFCDIIASFEQESKDNNKERDNWLFIKPKN